MSAISEGNDRIEGGLKGTGAWEILDKTVRQIDEERVKYCKDDMDTLLVFTGLYSAVLTALLVESYQTLQEDPQTVVIQLLQQISANTGGYTQNGASINATAAPFPSRSSFHATSDDIRVNVCWVASLIFSLSTASSSILVKQWLREYLAMDRITPQERIRIRHFRYQGLQDWMLFEIAAVLPLVLQLALALFFVGLCFFTASVHPSIAITSFCLVGGWAAFFFFALLAPILSPRCPYKTTFLKAGLQHMRHYAQRLMAFVQPLCTTSLRSVKSAFLSVASHITSFASAALAHLPDRVSALGTGDVQDVPPTSAGSSAVSSRLPFYVLQDAEWVGEEDDASRTEQNDMIIFDAVDSIYLNDDLLRVMRVALQHRPPHGKARLGFVVSLIRHRLNILDINQGTLIMAHRPLPYHEALSHTARTSIMEILSDILLHEMNNSVSFAEDWFMSGSKWIDDTLTLLIDLVPPNTRTPKAATLVFQKILSKTPDGYRSGCALIAERIVVALGDGVGSSGLSRVLSVIVDALDMSDPWEAAAILKAIVHWHLFPSQDSFDYSSNTYIYLLEPMDNDLACGRQIALQTLLTLAEIAATVLHRGLKTRRQQQAPLQPVFSELLRFIFMAIPILHRSLPDYILTVSQSPCVATLHKFISTLFSDPGTIHLVLEFIASEPDVFSIRRSENGMIEIIENSIIVWQGTTL